MPRGRPVEQSPMRRQCEVNDRASLQAADCWREVEARPRFSRRFEKCAQRGGAATKSEAVIRRGPCFVAPRLRPKAKVKLGPTGLDAFSPRKPPSEGPKNPVDGVGLFVKFRARLTDLEQQAYCI